MPSQESFNRTIITVHLIRYRLTYPQMSLKKPTSATANPEAQFLPSFMKQTPHLACLLITFLLLTDVKSQSSKVSVEFNTNISTYSIVEHIVARHTGWLFYIDGKANVEYLPMADVHKPK